MINQHEAIVSVLDSSHENFHNSIELGLILLEDIECLERLICPETVLLIQISDDVFVVLFLIFAVVLNQRGHKSVKLGLRSVCF